MANIKYLVKKFFKILNHRFIDLIGLFFVYHTDTNKSVEGSLAFIISQLIAYAILFMFNMVNLYNPGNVAIIFLVTLITCYYEICTCDNDNITLPLLAYPFLALIN